MKLRNAVLCSWSPSEQEFKIKTIPSPKSPLMREGAVVNVTGTKEVQICYYCFWMPADCLSQAPNAPNSVFLTTLDKKGHAWPGRCWKTCRCVQLIERDKGHHCRDLGRCCCPAGPLSGRSGVARAAVQNARSHSQCQGLLTSKQETVTEKLKKHMIP